MTVITKRNSPKKEPQQKIEICKAEADEKILNLLYIVVEVEAVGRFFKP